MLRFSLYRSTIAQAGRSSLRRQGDPCSAEDVLVSRHWIYCGITPTEQPKTQSS
jgi:hypothetical protein